jgi:hypothetical protein
MPAALGGEAIEASYAFDLRLDPGALTMATAMRRYRPLD